MFDAYRRPAWHAHYFEQESMKENLRLLGTLDTPDPTDIRLRDAILCAAHTDPTILEQAYEQDEENEPDDDEWDMGYDIADDGEPDWASDLTGWNSYE